MTEPDAAFVLRNPARKFSNVLWLFFIALSVFTVVNGSGSQRLVGAVGCLMSVVFFVLSFAPGFAATGMASSRWTRRAAAGFPGQTLITSRREGCAGSGR